jgi:hypothetical protein
MGIRGVDDSNFLTSAYRSRPRPNMVEIATQNPPITPSIDHPLDEFRGLTELGLGRDGGTGTVSAGVGSERFGGGGGCGGGGDDGGCGDGGAGCGGGGGGEQATTSRSSPSPGSQE